jgi:hypothetical protein
MTETYVTATDFRSHVAQITNCVAWRHDRVVVTRHGQEIGGFVCHEDLEFLRRYKPLRKNKVPSGDVFSPLATWDDAPDEPQQAFYVPPPPDPDAPEERPPDPEEAPYEEVKAYYEKYQDRWDESGERMDWYAMAAGRLRRDRHKGPDTNPAAGVSPRSELPCCTESTPEPAGACTTSRS